MDQQTVLRQLGFNRNGNYDARLALAATALLDDNNCVIRVFASAHNVVDIEGTGVPVDGVRSTLQTALTGTNNDLVFTADDPGVAGNRIRISYVNPGNNGVLAVTTTDRNIVVTLATNGSGTITSTAAQVAAAINAASDAPVSAANAGGNDGTGLVTALSATSLATGVSGTGMGVAGTGSRYCNYATGDWYRNTGNLTEPAWVTP